MQWRARGRRLTGAARACGDLRRRCDRRLDRLFPELPRGRRRPSSNAPGSPARRRGSREASWRATGATARRSSTGAPQFCVARADRGGDRRRLGLSPPYNIWRLPRGWAVAATPSVGWLSPGVALNQQLGSTATTAQVHPDRFTAAMMRAAQAQGAELRLGQVTGSSRRRGGTGRGVEVDGKIVKAMP